MAVDLFSLRLNIETSGLGVAKENLTGLETTAKTTAASMTNFSNAWTAAASKIKATGAELAAFKQEFSAGFFNEKLIAGMSLSGQQGILMTDGGKAWQKGLDNLKEMRTVAPEAAGGIAALGGAFRGLGELAKPFIEIWAAFKVVDFVKDTVEGAAALHEMSQKTGATVEMLSILKFAGMQADVSMSDLTAGFRGMALAMGRLEDGQKKTVDDFRQMGLTFADLKGLSPDDQFLKIAAAIMRVEDPTVRANLAVSAFGRSGATLLPLLTDLSEKGFAKLREEAEKGGGIITKEMADRADAFSDSIRRIGAAFSGLARSVLDIALPPLTLLAGLMEKVILLARDPSGALLWGAKAGDTDWDAGDTGRHLRGARPGDHGEGLILLPPAKKPKPDGSSFTSTSAWTLLNAGITPGLDLMGDFAPWQSNTDGLAVRGGLIPGEQSFDQGFGTRKDPKTGGYSFMKSFGDGLRQGLDQLRPFRQSFQSFFTDLFNGANVGTSIKQLGKNILAGMGSIFMQMAAKAILAAPLFQSIGAAMSNPFTAGAALLAFGVALTALGASMGGAAHGESGGGSSANFDRTTQITLVSDGAGGFTAPKAGQGPTYQVLGVQTPEGARVLAQGTQTAARLGHRIGNG